MNVIFIGNNREMFIIPGSILARVNRVESLATKQEVKSSAASLLCRSASSFSSSTWNLLVPEMFLVPPAPEPWFRKVPLEGYVTKKINSFTLIRMNTGYMYRQLWLYFDQPLRCSKLRQSITYSKNKH